MRRRFGRLFFGMAVMLYTLVPVGAQAAASGVVQTITVTASVAPSRIIIVNTHGAMVKIYSNTSQNVVPVVRVDAVNGAMQPLTPSLANQYAAIIAGQQQLVGVIIPARTAAVSTNRLRVWSSIISVIDVSNRSFH